MPRKEESFLAAGLPAEFWDPESPVRFDAEQGTWHVFSYADVELVTHATNRFSHNRGDPAQHPTYAGMWNFDEPRHGDLRRTVADPFKRSRLELLAPQIRATAETLLDEIESTGAGSFELIASFAQRLPNRVICLIMGVEPDDDEQRLARWLAEIGAAASVGQMPHQPDLVAYYQQMLDRCRRQQTGGLTDELIAAERRGHTIAGEPLDEEDLVGYLATFLMAGSHTTATGIGNAILYLAEYNMLEELRATRSLIGPAIEETLRWSPPFPGIRVRATQDQEIGGQRVAAGDWVTGWLSSANRDPERFPNPHRFDIRRPLNPHLAFGDGPYHCLGAPLARLEMRIALEALLDRFAVLELAPDQPLPRTLGMVTSLDELHVVTAS